MQYQLEIFREDGRTIRILVNRDIAEREFNAWAAHERQSADAIADGQQFDERLSIYDPDELYVRRLDGLTIDGHHEMSVAYQWQMVTGMQMIKYELRI